MLTVTGDQGILDVGEKIWSGVGTRFFLLILR
jgi:hypothetical protein